MPLILQVKRSCSLQLVPHFIQPSSKTFLSPPPISQNTLVSLSLLVKYPCLPNSFAIRFCSLDILAKCACSSHSSSRTPVHVCFARFGDPSLISSPVWENVPVRLTHLANVPVRLAHLAKRPCLPNPFGKTSLFA